MNCHTVWLVAIETYEKAVKRSMSHSPVYKREHQKSYGGPETLVTGKDWRFRENFTWHWQLDLPVAGLRNSSFVIPALYPEQLAYFPFPSPGTVKSNSYTSLWGKYNMSLKVSNKFYFYVTFPTKSAEYCIDTLTQQPYLILDCLN